MHPDSTANRPQDSTAGREAPQALLPYVALVEFLGVMLGDEAEVLLHDTSDFSSSIVAIANSHISGRSLGGPATDLVLRIWQSRQYIDHDYLANYVSDSRGGRKMRSSTFFIRNDSREVIGLLCINLDNGRLLQARDLINQVLSISVRPESSEQEEEVSENLTVSVDELTRNRIEVAIESLGIDAERMSKDERIAFIEELHELGIFLIKGSIAQVAVALKISEPTAYRYLKLVRRASDAKKRDVTPVDPTSVNF